MGEQESKQVKGYMASSPEEQALYHTSPEYLRAQEAMAHMIFSRAKGQVADEQVKFPKKLGVVHPINMELLQRVYTNIGMVSAGANKFTDAIMGDFTMKVEDPNARELLDNFVEDSDFLSHIRPWLLEGVLKGNGYMNLTEIEDNKLSVLNANNMYVKRNKQGKVKNYNQFIGKKLTNTLTLSSDEVTTFEPEEIAHLPLNQIPGAAYGLGYIFPTMRTIENYTSSEIDLYKLISRKAGAPYHVKVGIEGENTDTGVVDNIKSTLQYMNNRTEWVTDANVNIDFLDFKDVGDNLIKASDHAVEQFAIGTQIPLVILGVANIPEGLAKVHLEAFQRIIQAIRTIVEDVVETKMLRPLLRRNGIDSKVEFIWEITGEEEKDKRLQVLSDTLKNPFLSPTLKAALEIEYAQLLGLEELEGILIKPKDAEAKAEEERRKEEEEIKQPEVPGVKPGAKQSAKPEKVKKVELTEKQLSDMTVAEYVNITELAGFNYTDYLVKILQRLKTEKFTDLLALTEQDLADGLLPKRDIDKLRVILKDGFRKNKTIRQIEKDIGQSIDLKDRTKIKDGKRVITTKAKSRPNTIARTETVRLANEGLKDLYIENDVTSYRYLSVLDSRTSDICNELNGKVFLTSDGTPGVNMPPMHVNCRSTIVGLVEL